MKTSELAKEVGKHPLHVGRIRKKVSPDNKGGPLSDTEISLIKKELGVLTDAHRVRVRGVFGNAKYPNFVEAMDEETKKKYIVQIPTGYSPEAFVGRSFIVEQRQYSDNHYVYTYNPYKQDD